jgi:hypothetical protein
MVPDTNVKIIAQVGDTHSLKFSDLGKRRFIRLGASEKNPTVMQGTIHTGAYWGGITSADALKNLGLTLVDAENYNNDLVAATYFITGAIAYTVTDNEGGDEMAGILASVRESLSLDHYNVSEDEEAEFTRQYPLHGVETGEDGLRERYDNSVAAELDAILAAWERERDARMDKFEDDAIARL